MEISDIKKKIEKLPQSPGVYFFHGQNKEILYVGKATNLRSRVQSYFRNVISSAVDKSDAEIGSDLSTTLCSAQDDTKKMVHVKGRSEWIGLMVSQVCDIDFQETDSVLEALILESNLIKKHQPKYNTLEKDDKSFSYFVITKEEFPKVLIIRKTDLCKISNLKSQIIIKSKIINDKSKFRNSKFIKNSKLEIKNSAIYGPYTSKQQMQIALKIIRRIFPFHALKQQTEKGCLDFQLGLCPGPYADAISKIDYKKNIHGIEMILQGKKKNLVSKLEKEMLSYAKKDEFEKAAAVRNRIFALNHIRDVALMNREFESSISNTRYGMQNTRIEAYDISNISGQHAVGSMVVFENGQANKSAYRKFKIKTVDGSNDVAMMREVLLRRFGNDWAMPDLVLLDGGLGHFNMAEKLLHTEMGLVVNIAAVAKGPTRKNLDIRSAFIHNTSNLVSQNNKLKIDNILQDNLLVKSIMDEAHRFAIGYHRKLRSKNALQ